MKIRKHHLWFANSAFFASGLLFACVDDGHVLGESPGGGGGEPGALVLTTGGTDAAGASSAQDTGGSADSGGANGDGETIAGTGQTGGNDGNGGNDGETGGSAEDADDTGGNSNDTGGAAANTGGTAANTGGTADETGGIGGVENTGDTAGLANTGGNAGTDSTGGTGGTAGTDSTGGTGGTECQQLPSCNWCDGDELKESSGCVTGWICANGSEPCDAVSCTVDTDCQPDETCGSDKMCWPASPTAVNFGFYNPAVAIPCTTDPCLPGAAGAIEQPAGAGGEFNEGGTFFLTINGSWILSRDDWAAWTGDTEPLDGQAVMALGWLTYHTDIYGVVYMVLELTDLVPRTF